MEPLQNTLQSFVNSYHSIMWRLRECKLNDEQLSYEVNLSSGAIRNRRAKPDLWKLKEVEQLAAYFSIPTTACRQMNALLHDLPNRWGTMPEGERRRVERMLSIRRSQFETYNKTDWPVRHLLNMHRIMNLSNA
ncbi:MULTISPECIES: hypothetical protein [Spirosoma]|uniref:XRE family transcriptional regulator n=1 Tax=Spirosoma liriopis TaxID=2937440 RepID=A0ABT0HG52_9BACT|nr:MULTISPECIES: hypothetical protein [Spirosoma]MCK8491114.1 hypothetical protein [Spirosoma liriopis]UHG90495.1 hypothetical protein LQ777_19865 [Spirosoma oryzicola]